MGAKIHPKFENTGKNGIRKLMPKFDAKQKSKRRQKNAFFFERRILADFGSIFWPCRGVRGAVDTWKYRIDSNNLTRSPPRWGAADQNGVLNRSKIGEKLRLRRGCNFWAAQGAKKTPTWSDSWSQLAQFGNNFLSNIDRMTSKKHRNPYAGKI